MMKNLKLEVARDIFDVKQEIAHLFGICQYIYKNKKNLNNMNINFYNVVYDFDEGKSLLSTLFIDKAKQMVNEYIKNLNLKIKFDYQYKFMQQIYLDISEDKLAFGIDKKAKDILFKCFCDRKQASQILKEIEPGMTISYLSEKYNIGYDHVSHIINLRKENPKWLIFLKWS